MEFIKLFEAVIIAIRHDARVWKFLGQEIAEPHWAVNWTLSRGAAPP